MIPTGLEPCISGLKSRCPRNQSSFTFRLGDLIAGISQPAIFLLFCFLIFHSCADLYLRCRINNQNIIQAYLQNRCKHHQIVYGRQGCSLLPLV